jgi:dihydroorotase
MGTVSKDVKGEALTDMLDMTDAGAIAFSDGLIPLWNSDLLLKSLLYIKKVAGLIIDKPEDKWLALYGTMNEGEHSALLGMKGIPALAEELAVARDIEIAAYTKGRLHISNISTEGSVKLIRVAKKRGLHITCDVAAHQLVFNDSAVLSFDTNYKVNPPFRTPADCKALLKGLQDGTIDAIVSSHQPHDQECKQLEFDLADFGIIGQQTVLPMLADVANKIGWELIIDKLTNQARAIIKLPIPAIKEGTNANLMLFNPGHSWEYNFNSNKSKSQNSPLFGQTLKGKVMAVFNNGQQQIFNG